MSLSGRRMQQGAGSKGAGNGSTRSSSRSRSVKTINGRLQASERSSSASKISVPGAGWPYGGSGSLSSQSGAGPITTCSSGFQLDLFFPNPTKPVGGPSASPGLNAPTGPSGIS